MPDQTRIIGILLFDEFETLDVFGPVQMWGRLPEHSLRLFSVSGEPVRSSQGVTIVPHSAIAEAAPLEILMVPGGMGTRKLVENDAFLEILRRRDEETHFTVSVCTGAALLAKAGVLAGRKATTNKRAFDWVAGQDKSVQWQRHARWVVDGKYWTSSGVSAGTDLALAMVEALYDRDLAQSTAAEAEYVWNADPLNDPFANST